MPRKGYRCHMRRRIVIALLLCCSATAWADKKPKIAVLGLEVVTSGAPDKDSVRIATDLTVALRMRPKAGQGPWAWAPGSEKDLLDEKLLEKCETEARSCM